MDRRTVDFLVIGSGVAGLRAAIELAPHGSVLIVTKDVPTESSTEYAQGGIAVALSDEDEVGIHFEDTLRAGDGLCNEEAVKVLVGEGPARITELISWGAEFDKEGSHLSFTREAAHSKSRVLHAHGDSTGKELERVLISKVRTFRSVEKSPFSFTLDLIVRDGECLGARVLKGERIIELFARATILATGGAGRLYERTTNPAVATGDGMAIAYRAGAELQDMEFVQFHPTSLYVPGAPNFLLTEAMRGEGAILRNVHGNAFMDRYHSQRELAPRDVVSRAIVSEMVKSGAPRVYLDLTHLDPAFVRTRFPRIHATCRLYGVDIAQDQIPVTPAAHYIMGGVKTDLYGATTIKGLYAAGEVSCTGVHGANRLASNSLLEGLVFGARVGKAASQHSSSCSGETGARLETRSDRIEAESLEAKQIRAELRKVMWDKVGIIRCGESLSSAAERLACWRQTAEALPLNRIDQETRNMVTVAGLITESAMTRKGSIGAHYRSDFPEKGVPGDHHLTFSLHEWPGAR